MKYFILALMMLGSTASYAEDLFSRETQPELFCLALNIYHEARADNIAGQYAVADVVLNRVHDDRWPNDICAVVYDGPVNKWMLENRGKEVPIKHRCQFSWYCDGLDDEPKQKIAWRQAQEIAYKIYHLGVFRGITEGSTHYHATYVNPKWNRRMANNGRIGAHIFYRAD
jgi:spore germination cell wall hydrolase CwlJ-like protein